MTWGRSVIFSGYSGLLTNKTDHYDIAEIFFKVALNTITLTLVLQGQNDIVLVCKKHNIYSLRNLLPTIQLEIVNKQTTSLYSSSLFNTMGLNSYSRPISKTIDVTLYN